MHVVSKNSSLHLLIATLGIKSQHVTMSDKTHQEGHPQPSDSDVPCPKQAELRTSDSWMNFWRSIYRTSRPLPEARTLLPPTDRFEFCKEATLTPKEKSFVFACLLGVAPLLIPTIAGHQNIANLRLIPPELPLLSQAQLRNMAAWHLVDLLEIDLVQEVDSTPLEVLTSRERMQYLQESRTFKSVRMLEDARWQSIDVAANASLLSLTEQKTELLTDMVMLLNLLGANKSAADLAPALIATTMLLWSLPLTAEPEHRVSYFLAQHFFQTARCILLGKHLADKNFTPMVMELTRHQRPLLEGWRAYQQHLLGFVVDDPSHADPLFFSYDRLVSAGLWPLMINPFRLGKQNWDVLQHTEPYEHHSRVVPLLELSVMPEARPPIDDRVTCLVDHAVDAFSRLPPAPITRRGVIRSTRSSTRRESLCKAQDPDTTLLWVQSSHSPLSNFVEDHPEWEDAAAFALAMRETLAVGLCAQFSEHEGPVVTWPPVAEPPLIPAVLGPCVPCCFCREGESDQQTQLRTLLRLRLWACESPTNVDSYIIETVKAKSGLDSIETVPQSTSPNPHHRDRCQGQQQTPSASAEMPTENQTPSAAEMPTENQSPSAAEMPTENQTPSAAEMPTENLDLDCQNSRLHVIRSRLRRKLLASRNVAPPPKPPKQDDYHKTRRTKNKKRNANHAIDLSKPSTDLSKPSTDLSEPPTDLSEPSTDLSEPSTDLSELSTDLSEPSTDLSDPSMDVFEPSIDLSKPFTHSRELGVMKPHTMLPAPTIWRRAKSVATPRDFPIGYIFCVCMGSAAL
ncbi:MAG: uncharacterized protein KVP18_002761 [Porospora cf. gigantea A]|uniref:uncharacterized protein n=2 Tax=Porospora cf. gigantea A TaxID=2853593 RepID=UPI0035599671|nr:MAG: hypothetical protein KVP18_002761 [Porospora cf. gigantea A]